MIMKKKCLLIFKWPIPTQKFLINKFSKFYETEHLFISDFKNKNFSEIIDEINNFIELKNIKIVFFDVDFIKFINLFFIKKINNVKKVLMTFDDLVLHEMNAITANACDLVLSSCPLSVKKYEEKGYETFCMPCEGDGNILKNYNLKKEIDVLFFGDLTSDRKEFVDFIAESAISIKTVGYDTKFVSDEELAKLISKSKIVLNLSRTKGGSVINYVSEDVYKFFYQLKGRVIMSGLCGTLCISEYSPGQELMFYGNQFPTFYTREECVKILKNILSDKKLLAEYTTRFCSKILEQCEDKNNFELIYHEIEKKNHRKVKLIKIPYWYRRISAKQAIVRNIKLSKLIKTIFQINVIFPIIKNSSFLTKLLIVFETIINIFWYSFTASLKKRD